jgi:hypothetical protein
MRVSLEVDLLDYVDDGCWLVVPAADAPDHVHVSALVSVTTGDVELGTYNRATISKDL